MFKFSFASNDNEENETNDITEKNLKWLESKEILPEEGTEVPENVKINLLHCGEFTIKYVCDRDVVNIISSSGKGASNSLLNAEQNHSDLITAVYEGGLKIWECTFDLLHYIYNENINLNNKKVLDLGCGAGIIGIFSCLQGASTIFQDYNLEVIKFLTLSNVSLNNVDISKCAFYCGDWSSFLQLKNETNGDNKKFDYIFTSETIYNVQNYTKLLNIFEKLLKKSGIMYPYT